MVSRVEAGSQEPPLSRSDLAGKADSLTQVVWAAIEKNPLNDQHVAALREHGGLRSFFIKGQNMNYIIDVDHSKKREQKMRIRCLGSDSVSAVNLTTRYNRNDILTSGYIAFWSGQRHIQRTQSAFDSASGVLQDLIV